MRIYILIGELVGLLLLNCIPAYASAPSQAQACESPYIVQVGDSLRKIAKKCQVKTADLIRSNPEILNPDIILVGQRIRLPGTVDDPARGLDEHAGDTGASDTAEGVAGQDESNAPLLKKDPGTTGGDEQFSDAIVQYTVQPGDTLGKIARRAGVPVRQVILINPEVVNPNRIYPGQKIRLPAPGNILDETAWLERRVEQVARKMPGYQPDGSERWIYVDLASQTAHAYEGNDVMRSFLVSTGISRYPTITGTYRIWVKFRYDDMRGPGYFLEDVPYVMYFYKGYGLHGTTWHDNFGTPMSHGCVNLTVEDAAWLFDFAPEGTIVYIE